MPHQEVIQFDGFKVIQFPLGSMDNFAYLLIDDSTNEAVVIDPAWDANAYRQRLTEHNATATAVLLTHSHHDHVNALDGFLGEQLPVHISYNEAEFWLDTPADAVLHNDGDELAIGGTRLEWWHTPGHSPGSSCFLLPGAMIAADTLFMYGCGRCDMAGGDPKVMFSSLERLKQDIPGSTTVFPGHDYGDRPSSSFSEQLSGNPFLMFDDQAAFVQYRMIDHGKRRSMPFKPESSPY